LAVPWIISPSSSSPPSSSQYSFGRHVVRGIVAVPWCVAPSPGGVRGVVAVPWYVAPSPGGVRGAVAAVYELASTFRCVSYPLQNHQRQRGRPAVRLDGQAERPTAAGRSPGWSGTSVRAGPGLSGARANEDTNRGHVGGQRKRCTAAGRGGGAWPRVRPGPAGPECPDGTGPECPATPNNTLVL